jgi:hypothetical protein
MTWNDAQKAKLEQIELVPTTAFASAYREPNAMAYPGLVVAVPLATGGGAIPVLAGGIADLGVMTFQQVKFDISESKHFEQLKQALRSPPTASVDAAVREGLSVDPFFRTRVADTAPAKLSVQITKFGLTRSPLHDDDLLLRVSIEAEVKLMVGKEKYFSRTLIGRGKRAASAENVLKDPGFVAAGYREAAEDLVAKLMPLLDEKAYK